MTEATLTLEGVHRVRNNPFFHFDEKRVAVRAFFRSEKTGGSRAVEDWLVAEVEEILTQASVQLVALDDGGGLGNEPFDNHYTLVNAVRFSTYEPQSKQLIGSRDPRRCSLCAATPATATFRTEAHVLPESLGSRWLITYDECDACNARFGRQLENELAAMLLPDRVMARLPTKRAPSAKLKIWENASSIGGQDRDEALEISLREGEESVRVNILGDHAMSLEAKTVPFRPVSAIRSLARTAWHLLPPDLQAEHEPMRQWITGQITVIPTVFWRFFLPGFGLHHTTFAVWRRVEPTSRLPALVFALAFGNTVVVWASPDWVSGEHVPALLPLLPRPLCPTPSKVKGGRFKITRDDQVRPGRVSYEFGFAEHGLAWSGSAVPVLLIAESGNSETRLESVCTTPRAIAAAKQSGILYDITGGELVGVLHVERVSTPPRSDFLVEKRLAITYSFEPVNGRDGDVTKTRAFLEALFSGASVRIVERDGKRLVANIPSGGSAGISPDFLERALQVCAAVGRINTEFGTSITMPAEGDAESERNALLLTAAIDRGAVAELAPGGVVTLLIPRDSVREVLGAVIMGPHFALQRSDVYPVYGTDIAPGQEQVILENAELSRPAEETQRAADEAEPDALVTIEVRCTRVIHRFQRWAVTEPTP